MVLVDLKLIFQCKLWGFLLRHLFGTTLGTGDYGHLTIDHSAMLLRLHRSFAKYSNQGFEASHKVHRALYSRATCHDQGGVTQSCKFLKIYIIIIIVVVTRFLIDWSSFLKCKELHSGLYL